MFTSVAPFVCLLPNLADAQTPTQFTCDGSGPDWELQMAYETARFIFERDVEMTNPQSSIAKRQEWPHAFTSVSRNDTAIVIIDAQMRNEQPCPVDILTQRGQTPICLTGCCRAFQ